MGKQKVCSLDYCADPFYARGWCVSHYQNWRRNGEPGGPLARRHSTPEEAFLAFTEPLLWTGCLIWTGALDRAGYGVIRVDGRNQGAHRYAYEREHGPLGPGLLVDHRHHCNPACCEVSHLRPATRAQNNANRRGAMPGSASKYRGVVRNGSGWAAQVKKAGVCHYGGTFAKEVDAAHKAAEMRKELLGEYAGAGGPDDR